MIYLELFIVFFKIGLFSFGGGLAMLPLLEKELVSRGWITAHEFYNIIAVAQVTPGAISVNIAIYVGENVRGVLGSIVTTFGLTLPSFLLMFFLYKVLIKFKNHPTKISLFKGVKAASVALIFYASYSIGEKIFITGKKMNLPIIFISIVSFLLMQNKKIHPMLNLLICGILGFIIL